MEARDRRLSEWFNVIRSGRLRLPRFQRGEEWTQNEVESLLESVLGGLPVGATLVLEVGDQEPFVSRPIVGAPEPTDRAVEQLLDGQQRLTALWRSLHNSYERFSYFVRIPIGNGEIDVEVVTRWKRKGQLYPVWADSPKESHARGLVPLKLLCPEDLGPAIREWCDSATGDEVVESRELELLIQNLRARVSAYNIPFLSLPPQTPREVALDVFLKMNTTFVKLSPFDIVVAQAEAKTNTSLPDLVGELREEVPFVESYAEPPDLILSIAALRQDKPATQASFFQLDLQRLIDEWANLVAGTRWLVEILTEAHIFDSTRLPTSAVLPVIAALHDDIPEALDGRGFARMLMRKYLWRSSLTLRYGSAAATAAFQDFRALKAVLDGSGVEQDVPVFDESVYPHPTVLEDLDRLRWPRRRPIVARGLLAVSLKAGALDIADGSPATRDNLPSREYHHLFPDHLLREYGDVPQAESFRALNCALITWNTNRNIGAKDPLTYLRERTNRAGLTDNLADEAVRTRLATHLVPYKELAVGGYADILDPHARRTRVQEDYGRFLEARANLFFQPIKELCSGAVWPRV